MNPRERGFLLLTSQLGDPECRPLTGSQLRSLALRVRSASRQEAERELTPEDLKAMGYGPEMVGRILDLLSVLSEEDQLLLSLRFGLEGGKPLTPEEAGRKLNLTAEEVVAREAAALAKLRNQ